MEETTKKRTKKAAPVDPVRAYFEEKGIDTRHLDAPATQITDAILGSENLFAFIGDDARPDLFHYSRVETDKDIARFMGKHFVIIADWRNGKPDLDVRMRGAAGGVIMGRLHKHEAVYQAARVKKNHERKYGKTRANKGIAGRSGHGQLRTDSTYEAVYATGGRE